MPDVTSYPDDLIGSPESQSDRDFRSFAHLQDGRWARRVYQLGADGADANAAILGTLQTMIVLLNAIRLGVQISAAKDSDDDDLDLLQMALSDLEENALSFLPA